MCVDLRAALTEPLCLFVFVCVWTCSDIGGCKEQIEKMREVVELPMLHPEKFVRLGIDPPKVRCTLVCSGHTQVNCF